MSLFDFKRKRILACTSTWLELCSLPISEPRSERQSNTLESTQDYEDVIYLVASNSFLGAPSDKVAWRIMEVGTGYCEMTSNSEGNKTFSVCTAKTNCKRTNTDQRTSCVSIELMSSVLISTICCLG